MLWCTAVGNIGRRFRSLGGGGVGPGQLMGVTRKWLVRPGATSRAVPRGVVGFDALVRDVVTRKHQQSQTRVVFTVFGSRKDEHRGKSDRSCWPPLPRLPILLSPALSVVCAEMSFDCVIY